MKGSVGGLVQFVRDPQLFEYLAVIALAMLSVVMIIKTW